MYVGKLRSKEGTLEMQKTKKRWKDYLFRVNAQTYLLCFRLDNLGEPKDKIMLTHIIKIEAAPMKDADFPFAVHFKGKGSPWILRAKNDTERKQWMEAIKPGSSSCLSQPPPATQRSHHQPLSNPTVDPRSSRTLSTAYAHQHRPQTLQQFDRRIGRSNTMATPGHSRGTDKPKQLHKTPSADDQYVVMGSTGRQQPHYMHQHQMQQQPHQTVTPPQATVDSQARYQITASAQPQGLYHNAPQQQAGWGDHDRLALYHNAPQHGQMGPTHHPASNGHSLYQNHPTAGSSAQQNPAHGIYNVPRKQQQGPTAQQLQPTYQNPSAEIAPSTTHPQSSTYQNSTPQNSSNQSSVAAGSGNQQVLGMVEKMSQKFSPAQLQLMTEMLRELQTAEEEGGGNQGENAATSSLRSTLEKVLETTPDQHAYELLLDEETTKKSNYRYIPRPAWAKAETTEPRQKLPSTNEDAELTELLTIPKTDLKSLVQIGEGQFGKVFKALLQRGAGAAEVEVAVKTTKAASSEKERKSFLKEMRIMAVMMHPNIVKLYGLVQDAPPLEEIEEGEATDSKDEKGGTIKKIPKLRHVSVKKSLSIDDDAESEYHQLFEYVFVVKLKKTSEKSKELTTELSYTFPRNPGREFKGKDAALLSIPQFCFPDIDQWKPTRNYRSEKFSFVLTDIEGNRRFGYCRRLLPAGSGARLPEVYCIVSPLGCFSLYEKILDHVEERQAVSSSAVFTFLKAIVANPFPRPADGSWMETVRLDRPMDSRLEHVDFSLLFKTLTQRKIIQLFSSLLMERRVVLCAHSLSLLSGCAHALLALMYPFEWQHVFIPVLPNSLIDFVCSPLPYIIGINPACIKQLDTLELEEVVVVDLERCKFIRKIGDEASILPNKLFQYLEHSLGSSVISAEFHKSPAHRSGRADEIIVNTFLTFFVYLYERSEVVVVDLERCKFIRKIGDEASILPNKLFQYLEHSLGSSVISAEFHKSPAHRSGRADEIIVNTFLTFFVYLYGDYSRYMRVVNSTTGATELQRADFVKQFSSKSIKRFVEAFHRTQMFENFIEQRENPNKRETTAQSMFERNIPTFKERGQEIEIFSSKSGLKRWKMAKKGKK